MYEVTLSTTKEQQYLLDYVKKVLSDYINEIDGIQADAQSRFRSFYTLACSDTYRFQLKRQISEVVSQVLSVGCKNIFVRDLLGVDIGNFYQNVLINTLCIFDSQYDKQILSRVVDVDKNIFIDGYYNFRMNDVKKKWEDVTNMVVENNYILTDKELVVEFLQYLLESVEPKVKKLSICFGGGDYFLCDSDNKIFSSSLTLAKGASIEEEAMVNAICINPKVVKVYYYQKPTDDFCEMLQSLFDVDFCEVT